MGTLHILCAFNILHASTYSFDIQQENNRLILKLNLDQPEIIHEGKQIFPAWDDIHLAYSDDGFIYPQINKTLNIPQSNPVLRVLKINRKSILSNDSKLDFQPELVDLKYIGLYKSYPLYNLKINPVTFRSGSFDWIEEIEIEISFQVNESIEINSVSKKSGFLSALTSNKSVFYKNKKQQSLAKESSASRFIPAQFQTAYKIVLDKTGIYKISYNDLQQAEFPVDDIDPRRLAIFNRGIEIPVFVRGSEDGIFNNNDYFEFWGEKNEKTFLDQFEDMYSDPFSDQNVYWLVEKNTSGLRLIEENGSLKKPLNSVIVPFAYREDIHFEQDTYRQLFGDDPEKMNQPSYEFDHWFWGGPITAVESRDYNFYLPHPYDVGSGVFVKSMFRGLSIQDPVSNPYPGHQVSVWINDNKVGEITPQQGWKGQTKASISNFGQTGLPQSSLQHGENIFRVQMDQAGFTDITLFNWFNISYLRKYRADKDFIKFKVQDGLPLDETIEFKIDGFSNRNIDVYKLGISKITSSRIDFIDQNTTDGDLNSFQVRFQDDIFNPKTEYVAVTENAKLKPLNIVPVQPWKEQNPLVTLLDNSNSANVLLITNRVFQNQIERLRNLKELQGFKTEVVFIDKGGIEFIGPFGI